MPQAAGTCCCASPQEALVKSKSPSHKCVLTRATLGLQRELSIRVALGTLASSKPPHPICFPSEVLLQACVGPCRATQHPQLGKSRSCTLMGDEVLCSCTCAARGQHDDRLQAHLENPAAENQVCNHQGNRSFVKAGTLFQVARSPAGLHLSRPEGDPVISVTVSQGRRPSNGEGEALP